MLADISCVDAIYIVCGYTDMRKSIDGLCAIIQNEFCMNIDHSAIYLFCGWKYVYPFLIVFNLHCLNGCIAIFL